MLFIDRYFILWLKAIKHRGQVTGVFRSLPVPTIIEWDVLPSRPQIRMALSPPHEANNVPFGLQLTNQHRESGCALSLWTNDRASFMVPKICPLLWQRYYTTLFVTVNKSATKAPNNRGYSGHTRCDNTSFQTKCHTLISWNYRIASYLYRQTKNKNI